ncbi:MAG: GntR family transcriptional regulator [Bacillota bacterium]
MPRRTLSATIESKTKQIYSLLREQIFQGVYAAGVRLPSTRDLANEFGVSQTLIVDVFEQLIAEGYLEGCQGSGSYVVDLGGSNDNSLLSSKKSILPVKRLLRNPRLASKALIFAQVFRLWSTSLSRDGKKPPLPHMQILIQENLAMTMILQAISNFARIFVGFCCIPRGFGVCLHR